METGKLIKELRTKKGMTQEDLAEKTEVSARTIQRIENGDVDPRAYTLQMIAKALEVDFSVFTELPSEEDEELDAEKKRTWLALIHLSGILPLMFPAYIIYTMKKTEIKEMAAHLRATIAFQSMILFISLLSLWGFFNSDMEFPAYGMLIVGAIFSVWNALKVLNGKPYRYFGIFREKKAGAKAV